MERPLHPETMKMGFGCILFCAIAWERGRNLPGASSPRISLTRSLFGAQNCFPDTSGERVPESAIFHKLPQARCGRIVDGENLRTSEIISLSPQSPLLYTSVLRPKSFLRRVAGLGYLALSTSPIVRLNQSFAIVSTS